jgi:hypothetical protein
MLNLFVRNTLDRLSLHTNYLSRCWLLVLHNVFHEGEGKHLLDAVVVRQEHDETVDAHTPATSRRQTVLERLAEGLVNELGFEVTGRLLVRLLFLS